MSQLPCQGPKGESSFNLGPNQEITLIICGQGVEPPTCTEKQSTEKEKYGDFAKCQGLAMPEYATSYKNAKCC